MEDQEKKLIGQINKNISDIFAKRKQEKKFIPGKTWVQYAGSVIDEKEIIATVDSLLKGWFGLGEQADKFEKSLADFLGTKGSILVNSGSSADLLVIASLMSPLFPDHLNKGDEVITPACTFQTTVNPLLQYDLIPVFIDVSSETYNVKIEDLEKALSSKTRAVFLPHTLGNPNEMDKVVKFCKKNNLFLIEDNCDALGSEYGDKKTGNFGILSTQSFYPPHHITIGEGGMINYNDVRMGKIIRSLRDWGRDCWCRGDEKRRLGACGKRFSYKVDGKPYDHKYLITQIGYNLKPIEPQAAMGVEQLKKLPLFMVAREKNFNRLYKYAKNWENYFILPKSFPKAKPFWFALPLTIRDDAPFGRFDITTYLEERLIQTRPLFTGNIVRQPAYKNIKCRIIGDLKNSDRVLHNTFFVGVYPGLGDEEIDYIAENIHDFIKQYKK